MRLVLSYLSSISITVLSAIFMGFLFDGLSQKTALISLIIGILTGSFVFFKYRDLSSGLNIKEFGFWSWTIIVTFVLFSLRAFLWLIYRKQDSLEILSRNNTGDIAIHINYIMYFANGIGFWPDSPIYFASKLNYPIGMDLFNGILVLTGFDLIRGLILIGLLGALSTLYSLNLWGKAFTIAGFLFSGGIAGFTFFKTFSFNDYQADLAWKNIFLSMLVTQRGLLYAFPVGLLLLYSWRERLFNMKVISQKCLPFWIEALFFSSMPLFHMHTFIFLSMLLTFWILFTPNDVRIYLITLLTVCFIPATLFVAFETNCFNTINSIVHFKAGWMQGDTNFFSFWFLNFGLFWPLVIYLVIKLLGSKGIEARLFVFPAIFFFVIFCFIMLAPWEWDNTKLLVWSYIVILPFLWENLISKWNILLRSAICFILFFSGFVCCIGGIDNRHGYKIFKLSEIYDVTQAVKWIPIKHRFAAYPHHNHPLLYAGRKLVIGYPGWVWSHGYKLTDAEKKLKKLMLGKEDWEKLAKELNVKYIFWGSYEEEEYINSLKPWEKTKNLIARGNNFRIYDLGIEYNN